MNNTALEFYPEHPSGIKTHKIETTAMPILEQTAAFDVKSLCDEFFADLEGFYSKYADKRFKVCGIAKKIGPDIHQKPSIELSDSVSGQTYAMVIFPTDDHYSKVGVGDRVIVRANYLVMSNHYGLVMKFSELVSVEKKVNSMAKLTELPRGERPEGEELEKLRARVHRLETTDAERFEGDEPVCAIGLYNELLCDYENAFPKYYEKRIRLKGIVSKVGPDVFGAPSFEMTDSDGSRCYALIVFPNTDIYEQVREGQTAEIIGNIVFIREPYGLVVKKCELLNVKDKE